MIGNGSTMDLLRNKWQSDRNSFFYSIRTLTNPYYGTCHNWPLATVKDLSIVINEAPITGPLKRFHDCYLFRSNNVGDWGFFVTQK